MPMPITEFSSFAHHRNHFVQINDLEIYKRARVQLHWRGIVVRDQVEGAAIKTKSQQIAHTGDLLVAEIDAKVGGVGIVPPEVDGAIVSSHYFLFKIDESKCLKAWLDYYVRSGALEDQIAARGSTNYAAIRPHQVLDFKIPLPGVDEQRRIVARIAVLSAKIEEAHSLRKQTLLELEALWASSLAGAFRPGDLERYHKQTARDLLHDQATVHFGDKREQYNGAHPWSPDMDDLGIYEIPRHWVWTNLGSVLTNLVDCINDTPDFAETATGLLGLKSTNIRPYKLDLSSKWFMTPADFQCWCRREVPKPGDIVLTREAPMGIACILPNGGIRACLTQRLMLLRTDESFVRRRYLLHYLNSSHFTLQVVQLCRGLTTPHIRVQDAPTIKVPLAPIAEQDEIVAYLDDFQAKFDSLKNLQEDSDAELDALMPSILSGAITL
jgi:type I restriction enzyme S subunit